MMKFFKKLITLAIFSAIGYLGYKIFKIVKATLDLDKVLPQYLDNVYGEKPSVSIQLTFNKVTLTAGFSKTLFKKKEELEKAISDYVTDFYPAISPKFLEVAVIEKADEPEEKVEAKPETKVKKKTKKEKEPAEESKEGWSI
ncbi:MAG: hypothetical protein B1H06_00100 [Candidatus Cloacimonas sp. 4484_143]|nr:MAG: hypothetical protein B1H06_00100 [Candidatus Cloacimonas sp. 4484_143]RLC53002.1 MAG: hypothetical protein DRI23_01505 [Candidatus Cloacimonadota bacterium]RLC57941.1 MAG: hypothetical protein DRH89_02320 [Candidatus Cloacimonadota bacterium]